MPEQTLQAMQKEQKKRSLSGIQPTNTPHLGNYLGAMKNWVTLAEKFDALYFIADLHSITLRMEPAALRKQTFESFVLLLAMGIDPEKSVVFVQSSVSAHSELCWLLNCYTQYGELSRMTQFKDKSQKYPENINAGLFTYPVLMASDILLYQADFVPVGADQKQHIEIARDIAMRFNGAYSETFKLPEPYFTKSTAKIMSLSEPLKKMSKSDQNLNATVFVLDDRDTIIKKFKRAVTDSEADISYHEEDKGKAGINNLISVYCAMTKKTVAETEHEWQGKGYGDFKIAVGELVADGLKGIQQRYQELSADKEYISSCMKKGAERAASIAHRTLKKAQKKIGLFQV
ncbi:MAG: tryptophan--tRNA ligase [Eubacterium sp.]|jgi:tryptophanyl-tRNA synthetase|nr:tryptophan--tRNA ligase [Eubacterium sp.]